MDEQGRDKHVEPVSMRPSDEQVKEYEAFAKLGLLSFDINRYRDSIMYYCMAHDVESDNEYNQYYKPPFPITDIFKKHIRLVLQTHPPTVYLEHHDLYELKARGYDLIQTIGMGCEYWRDNAIDENISSKAKYVVDTLDQLGYEMGVAGNFPSVVDYVIDVLEYAEKQLNAHKESTDGSSRMMAVEDQGLRGSNTPTSTLTGAISGYALVEKILNYYGNEGVAKLLECTDHQETEFLEFKTDYMFKEGTGGNQTELDWDISLAIISIANTTGGALIIGIGNDNRTLHSVEVKGNKEDFLRKKIRQRLLPDQRVWKDGKGGRWESDELPRTEPRLYPYSDGEKSGDVVLILVEPQPRGQYITLENINQGTKLLVQREKGMGKVFSYYDSAKFRALDNERDIERGWYLTLLRKMVPDLNASPIGRSSGVYRFKPADGYGGKDIEDPLVRQTEGHQLCCDFKPGDQIDKYIVEDRIGSGGMGVVYRVRHFTLGGGYALKAFKMESEDSSMAKERFRAEAQVLRQLSHPGLPKVYDLGFDERAECYYLVQDLIVGRDGKPHELSGYVVNPKEADAHGLVRISNETALKWLRQVCEIANYLHGKGIAHRDITLKNLLIDIDGNVKLTDFGIAKVMSPELREMINCQVTMTFTQTPSGDKGFLGTLRYLPPEVQEKRKSDITPEATDVWAIGVSFFKVLTGEWFGSQQFADYDWNDGTWGNLLRGMLKVDSQKRMSCADVLNILHWEGKRPDVKRFLGLEVAASESSTWECISPNPYASASPIKSEKMFFGRVRLVADIVEALRYPSGGQCFVLYGQRRSGKTSVVDAVCRQLIRTEGKCIIASISAQGLVVKGNCKVSLFARFALMLASRLKTDFVDHRLPIPDDFPTPAEIYENPMEAVERFVKTIRGEGLFWVITIDEFTAIHHESPEVVVAFMHNWKAMLQAHLFNALIVGQDTMPKFMEEHPNDFCVSHNIRLSYLTREECGELASKPIELNGKSRYLEDSLNKIYDWTLGSPYLVQKFCYRLVERLNANRRTFVVDADIDDVAKSMCFGSERMPKIEFDSFVTAGDEDWGDFDKDTLMKALIVVAKESRITGWAPLECLVHESGAADGTAANAAGVVDDLVKRDALVRFEGKLKIPVKLFAEWLRINM